MPSPGLGFWQIYHLVYTVLSTSRQAACDVTVSRQCSPWSLSRQLPLGNSGILWGDSQDYTTILFLIKPPPKHQHPLVPHSLTITVGAKWWFYFSFQLHYSFLIHQQAPCCKEEVSFSLIYLFVFITSLFILILKLSTVWTVRAPQCGFSSFWTGPFVLNTWFLLFLFFN